MNEQVPIAQGAAAMVSDDGNHIALSFKTNSGTISIAFPAQYVGNLVAHLIGAADQIAKVHPAQTTGKDNARPRPIQISDLGVAVSRPQREARLSVQSGPLNLDFAMRLETLLGALHDLEKKTVAETENAPRGPQGTPPRQHHRPNVSNGRNGRI